MQKIMSYINKKYQTYLLIKELIVYISITFIFTWLLWLMVFIPSTSKIFLLISSDWIIRIGTFIPSVAGLICACLLACILFHTICNLTLGIVPLILIKSGAVILLLFLITTAIIYKYIPSWRRLN